jgi:hypothetical protein
VTFVLLQVAVRFQLLGMVHHGVVQIHMAKRIRPAAPMIGLIYKVPIYDLFSLSIPWF